VAFFASHQSLFWTIVMRWSGCQPVIRYGPVPLALRVAKVSSLALKSGRLIALFFSAQVLLMMRKSTNCRSTIGLGADRITSTVWLSTFLMSATPATNGCIVPTGCLMRWKENTTSSAVNGEPSWNLTPLRSSKRQLVGPVCVHLVASAGSTWYWRSYLVRPS